LIAKWANRLFRSPIVCTLDGTAEDVPDAETAESLIRDRRPAQGARRAPTVARNHLIELLPCRERTRLLSLCEPVDLVLSSVLCKRGGEARHVYFPIDGFVSLVNEIDGKPVLEVGMVGSEGMLGVQLALGVTRTPLYAVVQGAGASWRIETPSFVAELARNAALQCVLGKYLYVLMSQLAAAASCLRFHQIGPRLARWLLMTQDRAHRETFDMTHEFLAYMLGVRRSGVTSAAHLLQKRGMIKYSRGHIRVLNRRLLQEAACNCYAGDLDLYAQMLHVSPIPKPSARRLTLMTGQGASEPP
jgi:CRP-like cAMP-binding protein